LRGGRYHYYNPEEPDGTQSSRDRKEEERLLAYLDDLGPRARMGEPCLDAAGPCVNCPPGGRCEAGTWHPVPAEGHCYRALHPRGRGAPEVDCMRPCADPLACPGGAAGGVCAEGAEPPACAGDGGLGEQRRRTKF